MLISSLRSGLVWVLLGALYLFAAGCKTMEGLGEDLENAGRGLQNAAE